MTALLIALGGFLGAIARYVLSTWMNQKSTTGFPIGTLCVNLVGSFLLGILVGNGMTSGVYSFLGVGFMGAFTTFSTFKLENIHLHEKKMHTVLFPYLAFSYIGGIVLAFIGMLVGAL
nr:fluoride efflux transporter CrcB [Priestia flexa]